MVRKSQQCFNVFTFILVCNKSEFTFRTFCQKVEICSWRQSWTSSSVCVQERRRRPRRSLISDASVPFRKRDPMDASCGTSTNSMADTEDFFQAVCSYPFLYNVSLHHYRRSERRKAWREVAASIGLSGKCVKITRAFALEMRRCDACWFVFKPVNIMLLTWSLLRGIESP